MLNDIRAAITLNGGTPTQYGTIPALRELVTVYGGAPTQWSIVGLLREAITATGGTPTTYAELPLLRELLTTLGVTPSGFDPSSLWTQLASAVAAFDPASLFASGEKGALYDPSDLSTMFQLSDGTTASAVDSPVGYIASKAGGASAAINATAADRPTLRQGAGGEYYLEGAGAGDRLFFTGTWDPADPLHLFVAGTLDTALNNNYGLISIGTDLTAAGSQRTISEGGADILKINPRSESLLIATPLSTPSVFEAQFPAAPTTVGRNIYGAVNGAALQTTGANIGPTNTNSALGEGITQQTPVFKIYGALVINRALTEAERADVVAYLQGKMP